MNLVFLLQSNHFRQIYDGTLHGVDTFDYNKNFTPWPESSRLPLDNSFS